jgi:hypothetical protein
VIVIHTLHRYPATFRPHHLTKAANQPPRIQEFPMREFARPLAAALSLVCLITCIAVVSSRDGLAQTSPPATGAQASPAPGQPPVLKQMALTDRQIDGVLTAQKDMDAITEKLPDDAKPDAKIIAELDAVAKKNGFASYDEYKDVIDNISLVLAGIDPATKKYVGSEAIIKAQIAQIQSDNGMPANDKKQALADFDEALKAPSPPIENKGNIDLVVKYYDKLADALGDDQQ